MGPASDGSFRLARLPRPGRPARAEGEHREQDRDREEVGGHHAEGLVDRPLRHRTDRHEGHAGESDRGRHGRQQRGQPDEGHRRDEGLAAVAGLADLDAELRQDVDTVGDADGGEQRRRRCEGEADLVAEQDHECDGHEGRQQQHEERRGDTDEAPEVDQLEHADDEQRDREQREPLGFEYSVEERVERHVARRKEAEVGIFRPREDLHDLRIRDLGIFVLELGRCLGIPDDLLVGIGARPVHLEHDRREGRVLVDDATDHQRLLQVALPALEQLFLGQGPFVADLRDLEAFLGRDRVLCIRETRHLVDEGHLVLERLRQRDQRGHRIDVPDAVLELRNLVADVADFVRSEILEVLLVGLVGIVALVEIGFVAGVLADLRSELEAPRKEHDADERHRDAMVEAPSSQRRKALVHAFDPFVGGISFVGHALVLLPGMRASLTLRQPLRL